MRENDDDDDIDNFENLEEGRSKYKSLEIHPSLITFDWSFLKHK